MTHKDLEVWKRAMTLVENVYRVTSTFPAEEKFGLVSHLRRAAVSVPVNIAEGASRQYPKELIQFLFVARGSVSEIETLILLSARLSFIDEVEDTLNELIQIRKMLTAFIRKVEKQL